MVSVALISYEFWMEAVNDECKGHCLRTRMRSREHEDESVGE